MKETSYEHLIKAALGHISFQLVWAGLELGLFSYLSEKKEASFDEICSFLKINEIPGRILISGLTTLGFLVRCEKEHKIIYALSESLIQLITDYPLEEWKSILKLHLHVVYPAVTNFIPSLQANCNLGLEKIPGEGKTLYEKFQNNSFLRSIFYEFMQAISGLANQALAESSEWNDVRTLLDVGGGNGVNAISIAKLHSHIKITIYDLAATCEVAKKNISAAGLNERVRVWIGDFFNDPFPKGIDGILFAHIMPIWSPERNKFLLKKAYDTLPSGGRVFLFSMVSYDSEDGPAMCTLSSIYFLTVASGEGMIYCEGDYKKWLEEVGFREIRIIDFPFYHKLFVGIK